MNPKHRGAALLAAITLPAVLGLGVTAGALSGASAAHLEVSAAPLQTWKITHGLPVLQEATQSQDPGTDPSASSPDPSPAGHEGPAGAHEPSGSASSGDTSGPQSPSTPAASDPPNPQTTTPGPAEPTSPSGPSSPAGSGDSSGSGVVGTGVGPDLGPDVSAVVPGG